MPVKHSRSSRELLDLLQQLNSEGNTIVLITHDTSVATEAKRVVRIHDGQITFDGSVDAYKESLKEEAWIK